MGYFRRNNSFLGTWQYPSNEKILKNFQVFKAEIGIQNDFIGLTFGFFEHYFEQVAQGN